MNGPPDEGYQTEDLCQRFKVAAVEALRCQHWDVAVSWSGKSAQQTRDLVVKLFFSSWKLCFFLLKDAQMKQKRVGFLEVS